MRRHIGDVQDTHTMRWEINYIHPQSGRMLFVDMLCQMSASCAAFCSGNNQMTDIDR